MSMIDTLDTPHKPKKKIDGHSWTGTLIYFNVNIIDS